MSWVKAKKRTQDIHLGCHPSFYAPNRKDIPKLKKKKKRFYFLKLLFRGKKKALAASDTNVYV